MAKIWTDSWHLYTSPPPPSPHRFPDPHIQTQFLSRSHARATRAIRLPLRGFKIPVAPDEISASSV